MTWGLWGLDNTTAHRTAMPAIDAYDDDGDEDAWQLTGRN